MRGMGKIMYVICLMMCFCACGTRKVSTELTDYRKLVSELKELASSYERRTEVYKDSLMMMRGLMEKSSNITDSVSHLETSYAKSDAAVRGGKLFHSIENKDSIPGQVRFVFINVERHDTLWRERTDSATVEKKEKTRMVMEKKRFGEGFFIQAAGWHGLLLRLVQGYGSGIRGKRGKDEVYGIGRAIAGRHCIAGIWKR